MLLGSRSDPNRTVYVNFVIEEGKVRSDYVGYFESETKPNCFIAFPYKKISKIYGAKRSKEMVAVRCDETEDKIISVKFIGKRIKKEWKHWRHIYNLQNMMYAHFDSDF